MWCIIMSQPIIDVLFNNGSNHPELGINDSLEVRLDRIDRKTKVKFVFKYPKSLERALTSERKSIKNKRAIKSYIKLSNIIRYTAHTGKYLKKSEYINFSYALKLDLGLSENFRIQFKLKYPNIPRDLERRIYLLLPTIFKIVFKIYISRRIQKELNFKAYFYTKKKINMKRFIEVFKSSKNYQNEIKKVIGNLMSLLRSMIKRFRYFRVNDFIEAIKNIHDPLYGPLTDDELKGFKKIIKHKWKNIVKHGEEKKKPNPLYVEILEEIWRFLVDYYGYS